MRPSRIGYTLHIRSTTLRVLILTPALRALRAGVRMHAAAQAHVLEFCTFGVRIIQTSRGMHSSTAPLQSICELYQNHNIHIYTDRSRSRIMAGDTMPDGKARRVHREQEQKWLGMMACASMYYNGAARTQGNTQGRARATGLFFPWISNA